jgi:hypothetical protein
MVHDTRSTLATAAPAPVAAPASLDAERLDVFHVAVEFDGLVSTLGVRASRNLRDQLERASSSVVLNLCEGAARRGARGRVEGWRGSP